MRAVLLALALALTLTLGSAPCQDPALDLGPIHLVLPFVAKRAPSPAPCATPPPPLLLPTPAPTTMPTGTPPAAPGFPHHVRPRVPQLPVTGSDSLDWLATALLALVGGAEILYGVRRL